MLIRGPLGRLCATLFKWAYTFWYSTVLRFGIRGNQFYFEVFPSEQDTAGVDQRLAQLDTARRNLLVALSAVDELKETAERNKDELRQALARVAELRSHKSAAERELREIKTIA